MEDITEPQKPKRKTWACSSILLVLLGILACFFFSVFTTWVKPDDTCILSGVGLYTFVVGSYRTNCYVVVCEETSEAMVIDPGADYHRIYGAILWNDWKVTKIVCTHGHLDHNSATAPLRKATGAMLYRHKKADLLAQTQAKLHLKENAVFTVAPSDQYFIEGDAVEFGNLSFQVLYTPGHSPGGVCLRLDEILFTGDTLFRESVGRTDFQGSSKRQLCTSIKNKLLKLPEDTIVLPGHGPTSTIGHELKHNPFL